MGAHTLREAAAPASEHVTAASLDARATQCLADLALAWRALAEATQSLIALHEDDAAERTAFLTAACALTERVRDALDEAGAIVGAVPGVVHEEVRARLAHTTCEALLLQVAMLTDRPQL